MEDTPQYLIELDRQRDRDLEHEEWRRDPDYELYHLRGRTRGVHRHHRKLRSQGGTNDVWNLLDVTPRLHNWIHANPGLAYARGWLVHSWDDPRDIPVTPHPELREVA